MFKTFKNDVQVIKERDPAVKSSLEAILCYPGLHALWLHRVAHVFYQNNFHLVARLINTLSRFLTNIDIHPGATIGKRVFIDHGMGVVVGETAIVGDDVLIYQGVILGGTSTQKTKRHPTVEKGAIIGAGAKVMGNITVGQYSKIGTGAVIGSCCGTVIGSCCGTVIESCSGIVIGSSPKYEILDSSLISRGNCV